MAMHPFDYLLSSRRYSLIQAALFALALCGDASRLALHCTSLACSRQGLGSGVGALLATPEPGP